MIVSEDKYMSICQMYKVLKR